MKIKRKTANLTNHLRNMLLLAVMLLVPVVLVNAQSDEILNDSSAIQILTQCQSILLQSIANPNERGYVQPILITIQIEMGKRQIVGITRKQALEYLTQQINVTSNNKAYSDAYIAKIRPFFAEPKKEQPVAKQPEPFREPALNDKQIVTVEQIDQSSMENLIEVGESPLSQAELNEVMKWIAVRYSAKTLPFCWRQSYGRTAGTPMTCKAGYSQDTAGLCYQNCVAGEKGIATFCYKNCPQGLPDNGLYCEKRGEYGRGAGYPLWDKDKCNKENPQGCEQNGLLIYPKCKPGYAPFGCCLCKPACPQGWEDIGVSCKKPNYARQVLPLSECPTGTERNGALCYPTCKSGFGGVGPVCWQSCPSQQSVDCGAGCATTKGECAVAVGNMVIAPVMAALNIVSLGRASGLIQGPALLTKLARMDGVAGKVFQGIKDIKEGAEMLTIGLVGGKQNLAKIGTIIKYGSKTYIATNAIGKQTDLFAKDFADSFAELTTPQINDEIDRWFGKDAAYQIKREWGVRHLALTAQAKGFATAKNVISLGSVADPTGLLSVANAFMHPVCKDDMPFPTVHPLYNH